MLLNAVITQKSMGDKTLLTNLELSVETNEKVGIVGRNGVGKTTLFNILSGDDHEFDGLVQLKRGTKIVSTRQEHHDLGQKSSVDYIIETLSEYQQLKHILDTYPEHMSSNMHKISRYSSALEAFSAKGYYDIESTIISALAEYQIDQESALGPMSNLSGGQKRFVELVRIQLSDPDLALIDEPTNHMDFIAKAAFIEWLEQAPHAVLVITHDRDVLGTVERIIEIKDGKIFSYKGNYEAYLKQNTHATTNKLQNYEIAVKTMANLRKQIEQARARKPSWNGTADQKNPFVVMEQRLTKQLREIEAANPKPSFWIDQESAAALNPKMTERYDKYKAKNIRISKNDIQERQTNLIEIEDVQVGYNGQPLFNPVSFKLAHGDHLRLVGRNGAGKTTLVRTMQEVSTGHKPTTLIKGSIIPGRSLRLSVYEQEIAQDILDLTLIEATEKVYYDNHLPVNQQAIMQILGSYLFDPISDGRLPVRHLSGGQKARLQLIKMLAGRPNVLILDEPTNHLDLPSIEELETALASYHGAILFISHDSYFAKNIGGQQLKLVAG